MLMTFLVWLGLTRKQSDGKWFIPFRRSVFWTLSGTSTRLRWCSKYYGWKPYFFRNNHCDPWFHRRSYSRLLPFRWGVGWLGFELGDRGGEHQP